jgi:hypothetical protein
MFSNQIEGRPWNEGMGAAFGMGFANGAIDAFTDYYGDMLVERAMTPRPARGAGDDADGWRRPGDVDVDGRPSKLRDAWDWLRGVPGDEQGSIRLEPAGDEGVPLRTPDDLLPVEWKRSTGRWRATDEIVVSGKRYRKGQFVPDDVVQRARQVVHESLLAESRLPRSAAQIDPAELPGVTPAPAESGISHEVVAATAAQLKPGEVLFVRGRRSGAPLPNEVVFAKPEGAKTVMRLRDGTQIADVPGKGWKRVTSDIDPAFGVEAGGGMMRERLVKQIGENANTALGYKIYTGGDHIHGMIKGAPGATADYLGHTVYGIGQSGYVGQRGMMREMVRSSFVGIDGRPLDMTMETPESVPMPGGDVVLRVPRGAVGPFPVEGAEGGELYVRGRGGEGFNERATNVRVMNPTEQYPRGRAAYTWMQPKTGYEQKIDPYTGRTVGRDDPWAHITPQFAVREGVGYYVRR